MESLSRQLAMILQDVILCNLRYDALKVILGRVFGCTAFAIDMRRGGFHDIDGALILLMNNFRDELHKVIEGDTAWLQFAESGTETALEVGALRLTCPASSGSLRHR